MAKTIHLLLLAFFALLSSCRPTAATKEEVTQTPQVEGKYRIYVTNEASGEMSIIDSARHEVTATVKLGKRPRGIHASPDGKTIYVALSGSPMAPPGVDESKLPPPDRSADGIGVFDVGTSQLVRVIAAGDDPEEFDLSKDGRLLYVSNEDASKASIVDIAGARTASSYT
jgi:YVTN family beta-propeller protein